ncbi:hypothetical protein KIN20_009241 [Parelaphostrongylus tenuis]|uniref:Uncharacterized protein n=1 Tax=Parelaphostrongylus tenuis TaxID=148309 RepID=A0AAD5MQB7_PARTN|nr:hypothetical protein KIN20_009241 [Parelaphostrongylus tenuis]
MTKSDKQSFTAWVRAIQDLGQLLENGAVWEYAGCVRDDESRSWYFEKKFINYVNEICQCPRGTSIAKAVQQLGIPSWLVEIRHNASHVHVPPIRTLRRAFHFCRQWIWEHFWTRQPYEALRSAGAVNTSKEIVAAEASIRDQKIFNAIASYALLRNKDASDSISNKSALTELMRYVMQQPFDFIRVFVGDGCLIMTESQLNFAGYSVEQGWSVPVALQFYWKPVFVIIYEGKVVNELIINLLSRLSLNENPPHVELQLVAWTKFFLEPCIEDTNDLITLSDWSRILHKLVASTGYFDVTLVESVMAKLPNISEKRRRQVRRIMRISLSESLSAIDDSMSVRTLADLQRLIRKDRGTVSTTGDVSTQSHFVLCEPEEWCSVPLGLLPFKSVDNFSLIMDDDYMDCQRNGQQLDDLHTIVEDE